MQTISTLASATLTSNDASVTFSSIPQQYSDLTLMAECSNTTGYNLVMRFNGDGANNYGYIFLLGNGSTVSVGRNPSLSSAYVGVATTVTAINRINVFGYSSTNKIKTILATSGSANWGSSVWASVWESTAAITSITLLPESGTFVAGNKFTLTGVI